MPWAIPSLSRLGFARGGGGSPYFLPFLRVLHLPMSRLLLLFLDLFLFFADLLKVVLRYPSGWRGSLLYSLYHDLFFFFADLLKEVLQYPTGWRGSPPHSLYHDLFLFFANLLTEVLKYPTGCAARRCTHSTTSSSSSLLTCSRRSSGAARCCTHSTADRKHFTADSTATYSRRSCSHSTSGPRVQR